MNNFGTGNSVNNVLRTRASALPSPLVGRMMGGKMIIQSQMILPSIILPEELGGEAFWLAVYQGSTRATANPRSERRTTNEERRTKNQEQRTRASALPSPLVGRMMGGKMMIQSQMILPSFILPEELGGEAFWLAVYQGSTRATANPRSERRTTNEEPSTADEGVRAPFALRAVEMSLPLAQIAVVFRI